MEDSEDKLIKGLLESAEVMEVDNLTPAQRKRNMQNIKSKDTSIELLLRKEMWKRGYRYRKNYKKLPGRPDIVLTKYKIVIFCDGDFFHGKNWEVLKPKLEKSINGEYWVKKISHNIEHDDAIDKMLLSMGWTVIRFWGSDIKKDIESCIRVIEETIFDQMLMKGDEYEFQTEIPKH